MNLPMDLTEQLRQRNELERALIENIGSKQAELQKLLDQISGHWSYEDGVYRFYHQSFKVYFLQQTTEEIVSALNDLLPERELNAWFRQIIAEGASKSFGKNTNENWLVETRPVLEAFFHARYFLEMICRYADEIREPVQVLPSGWASILYLYDLR